MGRLTGTGLRRYALMAITDTLRMPARLTVTTGRIGLRVAYLSEQVPGSTVTAVGSTGADSMAEATTVVADITAAVDSMAGQDS